MTLYQYNYLSPIGPLTLISDGKSLTNLYIKGQKSFLSTNNTYIEKSDLEVFLTSKKWLDMYFRGEVPNIKINLKLEGSEFQKKVWNILLEIPYGKVITYKDIAKIIAQERGIKKMSAQAVGSAVGRNPISIIIPCHRVIGSNGNLTGYNGGIDLKRKLFIIERIPFKS